MGPQSDAAVSPANLRIWAQVGLSTHVALLLCLSCCFMCGMLLYVWHVAFFLCCLPGPPLSALAAMPFFCAFFYPAREEWDKRHPYSTDRGGWGRKGGAHTILRALNPAAPQPLWAAAPWEGSKGRRRTGVAAQQGLGQRGCGSAGSRARKNCMCATPPAPTPAVSIVGVWCLDAERGVALSPFFAGGVKGRVGVSNDGS